jgi:hypothetical protein
VDAEIMKTSYGKYLARDPQIILRALSISLELGLLVTITFDEPVDYHSRDRNIVYLGTANNGRRSVLFNAGRCKV